MSDKDYNIGIGVDATEVNKALVEINEKLEGLRAGFKGSGAEITKEMQRTAHAIQKLNMPLLSAKKELNANQVELAKLRSIMEGTGVSARKLGRSMDVLNKSQQEAVTNYQSQIQAVNRAKDVYDQKAKVVDNLKQRLSGLNIIQKEATQGTTGLSSGLGGLKTAANQLLGVFGFGFGLYGFVRLLKGAIHTITDFDESQKQLQSVTNATGRQMETLSRQAIEIGSASKYGAAGVSVLQVQLSRMGFTIGQIGAMAQGITNLATAAGEDLPKAAETVAFVLRAYNLRATETTRVTDTMAFSFTQSALDLEKFRQSMKYIAPIANQANFSLEDTTALLALLANTGISGSLAGTSLRNVLSQLADSSSALSKRVGITVTSFEDFTKALRILNDQGAGLEEVFEVMDRRAASAFTILLKNVDTLEAFKESMDRAAGAAERMAKIQKQSVTYQTKLAKAAWEGFILAIDKGDGIISRFAKGSLSFFSNSMNAMSRNMRDQSKAVRKEIESIKNLDLTLKNTNLSIETRNDALKRLKTEYPEYFGQLEDDVTKTDAVTAATAKATKELEANYKIRKLIAQIEAFDRGEEKAKKRVEKLNLVEQRRADLLRQINEEYLKGVESTNMMLLAQQSHAVEFEAWWRALFNYFTGATKQIDAFGQKSDEVAAKLRSLIREGSLEQIFEFYTEPMDEAAAKLVENYDQLVKDLTDRGVDSWVAMRQVQEDISAQINENIRLANEWAKVTEGIPGLQKDNKKWIEVNKRAQQNLNDKVSEGGKEAKKQNQEKAEYLRLQQKEQELIATHATSNIELERRLADIRKNFALRIAGLEEDPTKAYYMREIAHRQHLVTLQQLNQQEIKENQDKGNDIIKNTQEFNKLYAQLNDERLQYEIATLEKRDYGTRQEKEREALKAANDRIITDIEERSENEIRVLGQKRDQELELVGESVLERARLEKLYGDKIQAIKDKTDEELKLAQLKRNKSDLDIARKQIDDRIAIESEILDERLAIFDAEQEQEKIYFQSRRQNEAAIRNFEKEQAKERLQELKIIAEARKATLEAQVKGLGDSDPFKTAELQTQLSALQRTIDSLDLQIKIEPFDTEGWEEMVSALKNLGKELEKTLMQMLKNREDMAKRERDILDGRIAETQRAIDTELKLYEDGFAANVQAKQKELAELQKLREKALKDEEKAVRRRMVIESLLQVANLITAASEILKSEAKKGVKGVALAAAGIAAMFSIYGVAKSAAKQTAKYEKGGSFVLKGPSHNKGGVMIAPGHEGQGGERVSVFNRTATKRFGSQIRQFTDNINRGNAPMQSFNVFAENKDLKAMRKIMERDQVEYHNGYKVIRRGNLTTICRN